MKTRIFGLKAIVVCLAAGSAANGAILAQWDTSGFVGTESTIPSNNVIAGITVTSISLGSQLGTTAGGGGINTNGWTTDLSGANGNYYGFSLTVGEGYEVTLSTWRLTARSSNTGPRDFAVRYSGDSFAADIDTFSTSGSSYVAVTLDLSSIGTLVEGAYEFRVGLTSTTSSNGTGTVSTGGTNRIMNFNSTSATASSTPIDLNGTAIPEPAAAFLGSLGLLGLLRRRR